MSDMHFLVEDPRPDLVGSQLWTTLLRSTFLSGIPSLIAYDIACILWTMRNMGTTIRRTHNGVFFNPLLDAGYWENEEEFEEMKKTCLGPYVKEIKYLLDKLP